MPLTFICMNIVYIGLDMMCMFINQINGQKELRAEGDVAAFEGDLVSFTFIPLNRVSLEVFESREHVNIF